MSTRKAPDLALLERPLPAPGVEVHAPDEPGSPWIVQRGSHKYFRVGADVATLLRTMDGVLDHTGLADALGAPWTPAQVRATVAELTRMGLLRDGIQRTEKVRRLAFVPPMTVQFTVLDPAGLLSRLRPLAESLTNRAGAVVAVLLGAGGIMVLAALAGDVGTAVGRPLTLPTYLAVMGGMLVTTAVHELAHGAVLTSYGGRPRRMGVMLFYLAPAFFCDVSDGWRLPRGDQRVRVALAGVAAQAVIAGLVAFASVFAPAGSVRQGMLVFVVLCYVHGVLNLVPFVKLDGYIALMSHVDITHLRDRAMTDARRFLARLAFGSRHRRELPQLWWSIPFGLLCMLFPVYLVVGAMVLWLDVLLRLGGSYLVLLGFAYLLWRARMRYRRAVIDAREDGAPRWRVMVATVLLLAGLGAALAFIEVPYTVSAGYVRTADGIRLVMPVLSDTTVVREGASVRLLRSGLLTGAELGRATIADTTPESVTAPVSAFAPVQLDGLVLPGTAFALSPPSSDVDSAGAAVVEAGSRSLGAWCYDRFVAPVLRW